MGKLHALSHGIGFLEVQFHAGAAKQIGVGGKHVHGTGAPVLIGTHGIFGTNVILRQKQHQCPQGKDLSDFCGDRFALFRGDAPNLQKTGGLLFHDLQRSVPEVFHDFFRQRWSDAFDRTGGKVSLDIEGICRQLAFPVLCPKLHAETGVRGVFTVYRQPFAFFGFSHFAHHSDQCAVRVQFQYGIAVIRIAVQHVFHSAFQVQRFSFVWCHCGFLL